MRQRLILALLAGILLTGTTATNAYAEDIYRYWAYYQWTSAGKWEFGQKGSEAVVPADGAVEGWRFGAHKFPARPPRAAGDFQAICGHVAPEAGKKRVALVIDPGTPEDSPNGTAPPAATGSCVVTDAKTTGAAVLAATADVRIERGITCAIDGYPAKGCGEKVTGVTVPATDSPVQLQIEGAPSEDDDGRSVWVTIVPVALVLLLLAGGGYYLTRRRSTGAS